VGNAHPAQRKCSLSFILLLGQKPFVEALADRRRGDIYLPNPG
jgi:hypothetical protein